MHHKLHLRDDPRIDSVIFFEDNLVLAAHLKQFKKNDAKGISESKSDRLEAFKKVKSLEQIIGSKSEFKADEILLFRIFDRVNVKVDTTEDFPLDITCTLVLNNE